MRFLLLFALVALAACADAPAPTEGDDTLATSAAEVPIDTSATPLSMRGVIEGASVVAVLEPTEGNDVRGRVAFIEIEDGIRIVAEISGLDAGLHGFHVHETGDCSAPDASSAGGHFAPGGTPHGAPDAPPAERHAGDLGNLEAVADGTARYERVDSAIRLAGPNSIVGKAVVVHAGEDDLTSQPSGDAGSRVACGVIERMNGG
jgi:Cu-Zn family superoxide dismutase